MTATTHFNRGPYLTAAFICEKVLEEKDGVKSAIRIIDRVTRTVVDSNPPKTMEPFDHEATLFISLKSGDARGPHSLETTLIKPSGESEAPFMQTINFEGEEDRGVNFIGKLVIKFDQPGIYWFEVKLEKQLLTRIPFRVIYIPQVSKIQRPSGGPQPG